jgi:hypothetical protein
VTGAILAVLIGLAAFLVLLEVGTALYDLFDGRGDE